MHEQQEEIKRKRQEAVHKAQPVRHFRPLEIKGSDRPLTDAHSPKFSQLNATKKKQILESDL